MDRPGANRRYSERNVIAVKNSLALGLLCDPSGNVVHERWDPADRVPVAIHHDCFVLTRITRLNMEQVESGLSRPGEIPSVETPFITQGCGGNRGHQETHIGARN